MYNSRETKVWQGIANVVLIFIAVAVLLPFLLIFMSSITAETTLIADGYSFIPKQLSLDAYRYIWDSRDTIFRAYGITIFITVVGTTANLLISALVAYPLSIAKLPGRRAISFYIFFTMLFNGGLVPTYLMYTGVFHIKNTIFALIVPSLLMSSMNTLMIRTYFAGSIPTELYESAKIDGAGELHIFFKIALPLGKPILVTMGMFAGLGYWNDWGNGLYYLTDTKLYSIQNLLNKMITDIQVLSSTGKGISQLGQMPSVTVRMAIAFVAIIPILIIYPYLQKYLQRGIAIGAVKG